MHNTFVMGIDIGGTNTVFGFINNKGAIIESKQISTKGNSPVSDLVNRLEKYLNNFMKSNPQLKLIGIGVGAPNGNHFSGVIENPPNLKWGDVEIKSILEDKISCNVILTNDANAAALGEKYYGQAKNMNDFIMITLGTGLGSGIFSGGRLIYGNDGLAGEMGHIVVEMNGRKCNCGKQGCLEAYVSATGIKNTIHQMKKKYPGNVFLNSFQNNVPDGILIDRAYDDDDDIAKEIYEYTGMMLGKGLALAANLFSPEAFIFYGGYSNAGKRILDPAYIEMEKQILSNHKGKIKLLNSTLPEGQAGILGAASLIWTKN